MGQGTLTQAEAWQAYDRWIEAAGAEFAEDLWTGADLSLTERHAAGLTKGMGRRLSGGVAKRRSLRW